MPVARILQIGAYVLIPLAFISINLATDTAGTGNVTRWPRLEAARSAPIAKLDIPLLKQSVNRLPATKLLRQTGNSLRIAFGQQLSWCLWSQTPPPLLFHRVELWASEGLTTAANRKVVETAIATIRRQQEVLHPEGWTLVVVPVPTKLSIYRERSAWPILAKDQLSRRPVPADRADEIYDRLLADLQADQIPVLDLRTVYRTHQADYPADLLYPPGDTHWSGLGLKLAADATAELVAQVTGIKRRSYIPSYLEVKEVGDMAAAFDPLPQWTGPLEPVYEYTDRLVNGEEGKGFLYAQNPSSLLVATGTSYSGQFTWHIGHPVGFAWVLGTQLEETEFHNGAQAGQGSFAAFASFMAERHTKAADFAARRKLTEFPKVVVWEFPVRDLASIDDR